jgi:hypothetical protein
MSKATLLWFPIFECTDTHPKFPLATHKHRYLWAQNPRFHKNVSRRCLNRNTKHNEAWPPHFNVLKKSFLTRSKRFPLVKNLEIIKEYNYTKQRASKSKYDREKGPHPEECQNRWNSVGSWAFFINTFWGNKKKRGRVNIIKLLENSTQTHTFVVSSCGAFTTHV